MRVDVVTRAMIERPRPEVAEYAADPTNAPTWYANIDSIEWMTSPPLTVGSRVAFVARFLGRRLEYTYEIVEYRPAELLIMRTQQGPFPMETIYRWEDAGQGTRMILRNHGSPTGFYRVVSPLLAPAMRAANRKDLRRLKTILESRR